MAADGDESAENLDLVLHFLPPFSCVYVLHHKQSPRVLPTQLLDTMMGRMNVVAFFALVAVAEFAAPAGETTSIVEGPFSFK